MKSHSIWSYNEYASKTFEEVIKELGDFKDKSVSKAQARKG